MPSSQDLAGRVDGVGAASKSGFGALDGAVQELAAALGEARRMGEDARARLEQLEAQLEETGRRVDLAKKPGEAAVELLKHTAKVENAFHVEFFDGKFQPRLRQGLAVDAAQ